MNNSEQNNKKLDGTLWKSIYASMLIYKISYINKFAIYIDT
nr:MAG TPA: hypothetical protein [Caudoviricetes sp.]